MKNIYLELAINNLRNEVLFVSSQPYETLQSATQLLVHLVQDQRIC